MLVPQVGGDQLLLEQTLGLGFGYPAVVAVSGSKQRFAVQRDSFGDANTAKFVKDIVSGKQSTSAVEKWPVLKAVTVRSVIYCDDCEVFINIYIVQRNLCHSLGTEKILLLLHPSPTLMSRPRCDNFPFDFL